MYVINFVTNEKIFLKTMQYVEIIFKSYNIDLIVTESLLKVFHVQDT